ncbi:MAG TPA: hypothetical protein VJ891_01535, partial [Casimicrobiaceae bacterium]|nr:hypothetical protein [Casimicrobiaceae bacterium]
MAADLSQLQQALAVRWAYAGVHAFGLRAVIDAERDKLPASADGETFALVLERILAQMHDGHGGVLVPCAKPPKRTLPFTIVDTLDGVLVDEPDEAALVARGDRLLAIDGKPIDELIAALETRTSAATDVGRRARVLRQLPSTNANEVEVTIADRFWQQRTVRLSTVSRSPLNDDDWIETRDLGDRVAYVHFKSFEPKIPAELRPITDKNLDRLLAPYYEKIDAAFLSFAASRALVIDLRGNVGGSDWLGRRVARHLLTTHSVYSWFSEKEGRWQAPKPNFLPAVLDPYDKH